MYSGPVNGVSGTFSLNSPVPLSGSGSFSLGLEGVVNTSNNGANFGAATLTLGWPFNVRIPGAVSLTSGGSFYNMSGTFVQPTGGPLTNMQSGILAQTPLWSFTETYQGFRLSTGSGPFHPGQRGGLRLGDDCWDQRLSRARLLYR